MGNEEVTSLQDFKTTKELQTYADSQFVALSEALERIKALEEENAHLKGMLIETADKSLIGQVPQTNEQLICEVQIGKLKERAIEQELTMEEAKKLDIYIKNLYLIKGRDPKDINAKFKKLKDVSDAELIDSILNDT